MGIIMDKRRKPKREIEDAMPMYLKIVLPLGLVACSMLTWKVQQMVQQTIGSVQTLTEYSFDYVVAAALEGIVVAFYKDGCAQCAELKVEYAAAAAELQAQATSGVTFVAVNADESPT